MFTQTQIPLSSVTTAEADDEYTAIYRNDYWQLCGETAAVIVVLW